jgi:hypothetical protein
VGIEEDVLRAVRELKAAKQREGGGGRENGDGTEGEREEVKFVRVTNADKPFIRGPNPPRLNILFRGKLGAALWNTEDRSHELLSAPL